MKDLFFVFVGGGVGSSLRFLLSLWWKAASQRPVFAGVIFPWPTLAANLLGCFLIGAFYCLSDRWGLSASTRLLLTTGLCGGLTTFSTFSYESITLMRGGHAGLCALYVLVSLAFGFLCAFLPHLLFSK
ncbi:MAG: fluoride efflux transporter CrcB [Bacteroidales bacterium]|nr:fluoride efflux transporter CrcB [Candidatus Physcousia equi]